MRVTFDQLYAEVFSELFPNGQPQSLVAVHKKYFIEALIETQRWVECLQENNTSLFPHCSTLFRCGETIIEKPRGVVKRLYTIVDATYCDKVDYEQVEPWEIEAFSKSNLIYTSPTQPTTLAALSLGLKYPHKSANSTCGTGRARHGYYAFERGRIRVSPWIQSNETVVVEWDGLKRDWSGEDLTNNDPDFTKAIKLYILLQKAIYQGCNTQAAAAAKASYDAQLADLMWQCREDTKVGLNRFVNVESAMDVLTDDVVPDEDAAPSEIPYIFAAIGDYGQDGANEAAVAALIKSWGVSGVIALGDNNYKTDLGVYDLDRNVGKHYSEFIFPYKGFLGEGNPSLNQFWPVPGENDWDAGIAKYLDYFPIPNRALYYDKILGHIHFFFIDSGFSDADPQEPDGITINSAQAQWIRAKVAQSTVPWKIAVLHRAPYTSDITHTPGSLAMRWDFKEAGFDAVLSGHGHNYERIILDELPYFVSGLGGATKRGFGAVVAGSQVRYSDAYGALRIEATCDALTFRFINTSGTQIDVHQIGVTADLGVGGGGPPPPPPGSQPRMAGSSRKAGGGYIISSPP